MTPPEPPILDMTPQGEFVAPPSRRGVTLPWQMKLFLGALALSFVTGLIVSVVLLAYAMLVLLPAALALIAYAAVTGRLQRNGGGRSVQRQRRPPGFGD